MVSRISIGFAASVCMAFLFVTGLSAQDGRPPAAVTVVTLQPQTVTLTAKLPGRVRAFAEAEVRPQVNGIITERLFDEGTDVTAGDVLYRVDRGTYEAALAQAQANVRQAEAQLAAAESEAQRVTTLQERGISSAATEDNAIAARDAAAASLALAEAQLDSAQLELDRTDIRARLSGKIGFSDVSAGALVSANQSNPLTVIRSIDQVYVDVTQSAAEVLAWRRRKISGQSIDAADVHLTLADGSTYEHDGALTAAEPYVSETTGVVLLRLKFDNPDGLLLPGMYVQVDMPTGQMDNLFLAPMEGIGRDRRGNPTALIVNADNVVEQRELTILQDLGSNWVVESGFKAGDRLIVSGLQKVAAGATVTPQEAADPAQTNPSNSDEQG